MLHGPPYGFFFTRTSTKPAPRCLTQPVHPGIYATRTISRIGARMNRLGQDCIDRPVAFLHELHCAADDADFHFLKVESELMHDRRVKVAVIVAVFDRLVTDIVGGAMNCSTLHATA